MDNNSIEKFKNDRAKKMLVWLSIASISMFFAAFTSAYIVLQADHFWVKSKLPEVFTVGTFIIIISSLTIYLAKRSILKNNLSGLKIWLVITFVLGIAFTGTQYAGWAQLRSEGKFFVGNISGLKGEYGTDYTILMKGEPLLFDQGSFYKPGDISYSTPINARVNDTFNLSAACLYLLTGLHLLHLVGGLLWLIILLFKGLSGKISAEEHLSLDLGSIYWHFLDLLWVYMFFFLLFIR